MYNVAYILKSVEPFTFYCGKVSANFSTTGAASASSVEEGKLKLKWFSNTYITTRTDLTVLQTIIPPPISKFVLIP
jgi:hypothetical protein